MTTVSPMAATFIAVVVGASLLSVTARRLNQNSDLPSLDRWALADRSLGTAWIWLLLGGTIFTSYTFTAVPGLVYDTGAPAFFALPYTIIVCPLAFILLPRMWTVALRNGYVTTADFVRGRYDSAPLALVVALTGVLATMPYLALQLLGIRAVLRAAGAPHRAAVVDVLMVLIFAGLAVATYRHGLRAPTVISALKGATVFGSVLAVCWLVPDRLGGLDAVFDAAESRLPGTAANASLALTPKQQPAFATLAIGSALALLMYPHVVTAAFAASGPQALRRASILLPLWTSVLGVFGVLGVAAIAANMGTSGSGADSAVPILVTHVLAGPLAGLVLGAITIGSLVPAAVMSIAASTSFVRNVYVEYFHPTATPKRQVRIARAVSLTAKAGAVAFVFGLHDQEAINLQLLGGVWILQIFPAVAIGLYTPRLRPRALLAGWAAGMALGTALVVWHGFSAVVPAGFLGRSPAVYAGLAALLLNLTLALVCTAAAELIERRGGSAEPLPPPAPR